MKKEENFKQAFTQVAMIFILLGGSLFIDYKLTNDFLIRLGFDALSFFQVMILGSFTALMVGTLKHADPMLDMMKKERRETMSATESVKMGYTVMKYLFISHIIAGLVYLYMIIPHFFKG